MARAKKEGDFRFLNVQLPVNVLDKLTEYSDKTRIPKNAVTEIALNEYLDKVMVTKEDK